MEKFRLVVAGGRDFNDFGLLTKYLDMVLKNAKGRSEIVIVTGKARGADALGEKYALLRGFTIQEHAADWDKHGKSAGYKRNEVMAKNSDATVAFWDGKSKGTEHMINLTRKYGNKLKVFKYGQD